MLEIILLILLIIAVFVIGMVGIFKWAFRKGRESYTKVRDRRNERKK